MFPRLWPQIKVSFCSLGLILRRVLDNWGENFLHGGNIGLEPVLVADIGHQLNQNASLVSALLPRELYLPVNILDEVQLVRQSVERHYKVFGPKGLLLHFLFYFFVFYRSNFFEKIDFVF